MKTKVSTQVHALLEGPDQSVNPFVKDMQGRWFERTLWDRH